jgi:multidrug transporter EmrE-like cation transporter
MLGGMLLPAVVGVVFYSEKLTWGLGVCIIFIVASLLLLIDRQGESKKGAFFIYAGVFIFNGLSGVISKIYTDSTCPKASSMGFSLLTAIVVFACCLVVLLFVWKNRVKTTNKALIGGLIAGPLSKIANYFLLIALAVLPASVNYSFVTGGTIIVSTVIAYFTPCKPKKREWLAVGLAFIGIICLTTF